MHTHDARIVTLQATLPLGGEGLHLLRAAMVSPSPPTLNRLGDDREVAAGDSWNAQFKLGIESNQEYL
jgi:hypothetical protein